MCWYNLFPKKKCTQCWEHLWQPLRTFRSCFTQTLYIFCCRFCETNMNFFQLTWFATVWNGFQTFGSWASLDNSSSLGLQLLVTIVFIVIHCFQSFHSLFIVFIVFTVIQCHNQNLKNEPAWTIKSFSYGLPIVVSWSSIWS